MFKKSRPYQEPDLFKGIMPNLGERKARLLEDPLAWHNVFYREITSSIDESIYSVLYAGTGRPNSPVRLMVAMLILKEGQGWSDEQLFNESLFDLRIMRALGLTNLDDEVPAESTYYDFQARLHRHKTSQGLDLLEQTFQQLTKGQLHRFKIPGNDVRMDSKLFNSNIAKSTRLQLVIGTVVQFFKGLSEAHYPMLEATGPDVPGQALLRLKELAAKPVSTHTWPLSNEQKSQWLAELGTLALRLVRTFDESHSTGYPLLKRLLEEQFEFDETGQEARPKDKGKMQGGSLQSPHDPDASYRFKESGNKKQTIQGFSANITETCDPGPLHLITDVLSGSAGTPDDTFLQPAIERTEMLAGQVKNAWTDGSYNSQDNLAFVNGREGALNWYLGAIQGSGGNFDFERTAAGGLLVTDRRTGRTQAAVPTPKSGWRIEDAPGNKGKFRYIEDPIVVNYFRRKDILTQPLEIRLRRPNVESTIHHVFYPLDGNQSKYRGLERNHRFVLCRCFWVNVRRIGKFLREQTALASQKIESFPQNLERQVENAQKRLFLAFFPLWHPVARLREMLNMQLISKPKAQNLIRLFQ